MKVRITNMKAPWPKGSGIGAVVSFEGDTAPGWAVGKFTRVGDDVAADFAYEPAEIVGDGSGAALPSIDAVNMLVADLKAQLADAELRHNSQANTIRQLVDEVKAGAAEARDLGEKLSTADAANAKLTAEKAAAEADAKDAREKLATAEAALAAAPKATAAKGNGK